MSKRVDAAPRRFFNLIAPDESWCYTGHSSKRLVVAAFERLVGTYGL